MSSKRILVLGAGLMAPPLVRYLLHRTQHQLLVAALDTTRVLPVLADFSRGRAIVVDLTEDAVLGPLMDEADLVISLLPSTFNPRLARMAIDRRLPLINTSYAAPEMWALDEEAKRAGVLLLNEIGLDPGLDHMSAVRLIRRAGVLGGRVSRFLSVCGGFPAPDANDNPWGYKFSWFPRAVLLAARNPARYLRKGEIVEIPGPELFQHRWPFPVDGIGVLEIYPNRDATIYREAYGLSDVEDLFRGTLRYPGWSETMNAVAELGLLDLTPIDWKRGATYRDLTTRLIDKRDGAVVERVAAFLQRDEDDPVLGRLEWVGLLSDRELPVGSASPLDLLVARIHRMMQYRPGERDMVHLEHRLRVFFPDGRHDDVRSTLNLGGEPWGDSAMSRTVALPAAIAARRLLDDEIRATGVHIPVIPEIYRPVLEDLEQVGITIRDRWSTHHPSPFDDVDDDQD